jgi:ribosomal protein S8
MDDEDEMMRLAIEASLQDFQAPNGEEKEKETPLVAIEPEKKIEPEIVKTNQKVEYMKDFQKYIGNNNSTRIQLRLPNGKREVLNVSVSTPLSAIYSIVHDKLMDNEKEKRFSVIYLNESLANTNDVTLEQKNIKGASLSILFEDE